MLGRWLELLVTPPGSPLNASLFSRQQLAEGREPEACSATLSGQWRAIEALSALVCKCGPGELAARFRVQLEEQLSRKGGSATMLSCIGALVAATPVLRSESSHQALLGAIAGTSPSTDSRARKFVSLTLSVAVIVGVVMAYVLISLFQLVQLHS